jgi:hypothetical protein
MHWERDGKPGPKGIVFDDEMLEKIEQYAAQGLTQEQISHNLNMHSSTYFDHKRKNPLISEAFKRGKAKGVQVITNALFNKAAEGDNTAMIFYLKNRDRDNWGDKKEINVNTTTVLTEDQKAILDSAIDGEF